jgi:hypothetical protein
LDGDHDPRWIRVLVLAIAAAVAAFASVALTLAMLGWYRLPLVLLGGSVLFVGLCALARPLLTPRGEVTRAARIGAALAVVAVLAITVWNVANASEQVLIVRDGGTYLNAGKWIASHGTLEVKPFVGPFNPRLLAASSAGMSRQGNHLDFTLEHLLPALLAVGQGIGGDRLMFATVPLLGGAALLAFYLLARRVLRYPIAALGAMLCLGLLMPQVSFSRDSMTEIPMQLLLFAGAWLLCDARTLEHRDSAFLVGLFLGLLQAIHIDGLVFVVGLPIVGLVAWLRTEPSRRRRVGGALAFAGLGVAAGTALSLLDLFSHSPLYLHTLHADLERLGLGAGLAIGVAVVSAWVVRWWARRPHEFMPQLRRTVTSAGFAAAGLILVGGFGAWLGRPYLETTRGPPNIVVKLVQTRTHLPVDPTRRYFEHSLEWASWYVGPITLSLAIIGAAYATRAFMRGTLREPCRVAALVLGPAALLYLWKPSITPDQIWAARRFLPALFPLVVLAAFGMLCRIAAWDRIPTVGRRALAVALGGLAVAYPVHTIWGVSRMTDQRGFPPVVKEVCRIVGDHGAIVVPQEVSSSAWVYDPQTLRSFCNVPVAVMLSGQRSELSTRRPGGRLDPALLRSLAKQWRNQNRQLFLVAGTARTITKLFPNVTVRLVPEIVNSHLLVQTLVSRPDAFQTEGLSFAIARVPAA